MTQDHDEERRVPIERRKNISDQHWHLEKSVSVSHIFSTLSLAGALFFTGTAIFSRVSVLEEKTETLARQDARIEGELKDSVRRIEESVIRIETSLAEKADRQDRRMR